MNNIADVTGGKPIAVLVQSISGVSAINPLVAFYDIHGGSWTMDHHIIIAFYLLMCNP
jgi:ABC-type transport system involved in Fe-S cluster assembly fused permease/ATPase subunit